MREDIELTRVLGVIYNAALDPELWTDALAGVAEFVGGSIGALGAEDRAAKLQAGKLIGVDDMAGLDLQYGQRHERGRGTRGGVAPVPPLNAGEVATLAACMPRHGDSTPPRSKGNAAGAVP